MTGEKFVEFCYHYLWRALEGSYPGLSSHFPNGKYDLLPRDELNRFKKTYSEDGDVKIYFELRSLISSKVAERLKDIQDTFKTNEQLDSFRSQDWLLFINDAIKRQDDLNEEMPDFDLIDDDIDGIISDQLEDNGDFDPDEVPEV